MVGTNTDEHRLFLATTGAIDLVAAKRLSPAPLPPTGFQSNPRWLSTERRARAPLPATCSRPSSPTGSGVFPQFAWRTRMPPATASTYMYEFRLALAAFDGRLGACHALEITVRVRHAAQSGPSCCGERIHHSNSPTPCTRPGWRSPRVGVAIGRLTIPNRRTTMRFSCSSEAVDDPRSPRAALSAGIR